MRKHRNRVATNGGVIATVALVLLTAACGSSGGSKGASANDSTTTTKPNPAADRTRAESLLLVTADLPTGWVGSKHVKDPEDAAENQKLADCTGAFDPKADVVDIDGDDFDKGSAEISSSVSVVDTRAHFLSDVTAAKGAKLLTCVQTIFSEDLPKSLAKSNPGVTVRGLKVTRLSSKTYGEITVGFRVSLTVAGPQGSIPLFIDEFQLGSGRDEVSLTFDNQATPFDSTLEQTVLATAGGKLGKSAA